MNTLVICLYVASGIQVFGELAMVAKVGQARQPITGEVAALSVILSAFVVTVMIIAALKLS